MTIHRAVVLGSMLRPEHLKRARAAFDAGKLTASELKRAEDRAVDKAIAVQEGAGLDVVTDGEMRREDFMSPIHDATTGVERASGSVTESFRVGTGGIRWMNDDGIVPDDPGKAVTGPLVRRRSLLAEEYSYARGRALRPLKVTLPSPALIMVVYVPHRAPDIYRDPDHLVADAAKVVRADIEELAALGCTEIQIDAPDLTGFCDEGNVSDWNAQTRVALIQAIEALNDLVAEVPGVTFSVHLCRGNNKGMWAFQGGYDRIAEELFARATNFDRFLLEYDTPRAGGFEPLAAVPDDKTVVLGLVSTKTPQLEIHDELVGRVREAARYCSLDRLAVSTQCGFASGVEGNPITEDDQLRKLRLVADVADAVWG